MVMPEGFLAALQQDPAAHVFYATLKRQKCMAEMLAKLARGERL